MTQRAATYPNIPEGQPAISVIKALADDTRARNQLGHAVDAFTAPICVACVGDRTNLDGGLCLRCNGSGTDPYPLAPTRIAGAL